MDEEINEIVDKVFRESMLNPATMNFLSDDMQNQFLKESLRATILIGKSNSEDDKPSEERKSLRYIDMFGLRVLSLLVCRGKQTEKAKYLANLVNLSRKQPVHWDNPRLRKAIRLIVYFSSILPLKFLSENQDKEVFDKMLSLGKYSHTRKAKRSSVLVYEVDKSNLWSQSQIN